MSPTSRRESSNRSSISAPSARMCTPMRVTYSRRVGSSTSSSSIASLSRRSEVSGVRTSWEIAASSSRRAASSFARELSWRARRAAIASMSRATCASSSLPWVAILIGSRSPPPPAPSAIASSPRRSSSMSPTTLRAIARAPHTPTTPAYAARITTNRPSRGVRDINATNRPVASSNWPTTIRPPIDS